jgi:hypothetical protein
LATTLDDWSMTSGARPLRGAAKASGLVPKNGVLPPNGAIDGDAFAAISATRPCSANSSTKKPSEPQA